MYEVRLSSEAEKYYKRIYRKDPQTFRRIDNALGKLSQTPQLGNPLTGPLSGLYSLRIGKYRIVYKIVRRQIMVYILALGHREGIYEDLARYL